MFIVKVYRRLVGLSLVIPKISGIFLFMPPAQPYDNTNDQQRQRKNDRKESADGKNLEICHGQGGGIQRFGGDREGGFTAKQAI